VPSRAKKPRWAAAVLTSPLTQARGERKAGHTSGFWAARGKGNNLLLFFSSFLYLLVFKNVSNKIF
jgi:hypothetical protein